MIPRRFYIFDATPNNVRIFTSLFYVFQTVVIFDVLFCSVPRKMLYLNRYAIDIQIVRTIANCVVVVSLMLPEQWYNNSILCTDVQSHTRSATVTIN